MTEELLKNGYITFDIDTNHTELNRIYTELIDNEKFDALKISYNDVSDNNKTPFVNFIQNYVYLQPMDSMVEGIKVFEYRQQDQVLFYGADIGIHYHPHFAHKLHFESSISYVNAFSGFDSSISLIPQPRLSNTIRFDLNFGKFVNIKDLTLTHTYFMAQNNVANNEKPSSAYNLLDFSGTLQFLKKSNLSMNAGIKNILNEEYIDHLSRLKNIEMYAPSRTFFISLKWHFNNATQ